MDTKTPEDNRGQTITTTLTRKGAGYANAKVCR
ncbi:hypothetical protein WI0192307A02_CDS0081 [Pseudomonas phage KG853]